MTPPADFRARRLSLGLGLRGLERRTGINRGRLSVIERGVPPTEEEELAITAALDEEELMDRSQDGAPGGST